MTIDDGTKFWSGRTVHLLVLGVLAVGFLAPTLGWRDFTDGMENFNVLTAVECARDGHWLIPTSNGLPRLQKPPLTSWLTAGGILLGGRLEWAARWPSLIIAWILLAAVYETGRLLRDGRFGFDAALIAATTVFFLRYSRRASYDLQLAAWTAVCNWFVVLVACRGNWIVGCALAGAGLGLALMTKGPVALTWTVLPVAAWVVSERFFGSWGGERAFAGRRIAAIAIGIAVALAVAMPWVVYVYAKAGSQLSLWMNEVRLEDEQVERARSHFGEAMVCLAQLMPWTPLMVVGFAGVRRGMGGLSASMIRLMGWAVVLPIVVVSCVPPVRDRYLLPMIAPAAILAAAGLQTLRQVRCLNIAQWLIVGIMALGVPIAGMAGYTARHIDGRPMFAPMEGMAFLAILGGLLAVAAWVGGRRPTLMVLGWGVVILASNMQLAWGERLTAEAFSPDKFEARQIARRWPTAKVICLAGDLPPRGLSIYLDLPNTPVETIERLPDSSEPQLLILPARATAEQAPQGWRLCARFKKGRVDWIVYQRGGT
jgi:4-amino-4-deoxy-L-arabinose transferase-like glycosyltransferase